MTATVPGTPAPPLAMRLFGPFEARVHGAPLPRLRSRKGPWLLALLTLRHGAEVERSWLAGLLWPDSPERQALGQLRNSLADLRTALGPEAPRLRSPTPRTLLLDLAGAEVDVVAFDAALRRGDAASLEAAVALYRGPLLEGGTEEWMFQERQPREQAFLTALETLAADARERGEFATAEQYLRRVIGVDPTREGAQRGLMETLAASGNYAAAIQVYRELREYLHREMNSAPDAATSALFERLREEARRRAGAPLPSEPETVSPSTSHPLDPPLLPQGTVTFLFTDIEGSTRLWEQYPDAMREALARHDALLRAAIEAHSGFVFKTGGDAFCAVFARAADALRAAAHAQHALQSEPWGKTGPLRVRMALHTGAAQARDGDYFGPPLNRVARLLDASHGSQMLLSQVTAELVRGDLPASTTLRDLGAHRLKDLQQPEHLFQVVDPHLPGEFPPLRAMEAFAHNLPRQLTSFIGREREMDDVKRILTTSALVTLTGAGGCGKTRLALQVAADLVGEFADGVWLVELAALSDPALVPQTAAAALGLQEAPDRPLLATLTDYLRPKHLLLVLDNCEHLLTASAQLAVSLLRACPKLRLLVSSREGLGIAGETTYPLPALAVPDLRQPSPTLADITGYESVRLFVDRATAALPSFRVTNENAAAVAQVCHRLDGIPLAIELAAARVKVLPVETINERLDDRFRLLTGGSRTALPRQQTLRALIDWSYDLLTEGEQTLLRRLSVFAGGWTLEAAEAVCAGESIAEGAVLDLLSSLIEKSLVLYDEEPHGRYRLLEMVRQYGWGRLLEAGEAESLRDRHQRCFLELAGQERPRFQGTQLREWLDRLETEYANLRTAFEWSLTSEERAEAGLRLANSLWGFWDVRLHRGEAWARLNELLEMAPNAPLPLRASALKHAASHARYLGDIVSARSLIEQSLAIFRQLGNRQGIASALAQLGGLTADADPAAAYALMRESLTLYRELDRRQELQNRGGMYWLLTHLGSLDRRQGDASAARALLSEALDGFRQLGDAVASGWVLWDLGEWAHQRRDYAGARSHFVECLALFQDVNYPQGIVRSIDSFAALAFALGQLERAARLFGAGVALRDRLSAVTPYDEDHTLTAARSAMRAEAFAAAWAAGQSMTLEGAIAYALDDAAPGGVSEEIVDGERNADRRSMP